MSSSPWHGMQGRVPSLMRLSADRKPGEQPKPPANKQSDGFADVVLAAQAAERARVTAAALCCPCYLLVARGGDAARRRLRAFIGSLPYEIMNIVVTLYVIFVEDIVVAWLPKSVDSTIEALTTAALLIFIIDLVLASSLDRKHVFTVFWWIDVLGVLSILLELSWFSSIVLPLFTSTSDDGSQPSIIRIGKAARAGSRAGRTMRLVRMIRLVRIVRLLRFVRRSRSRLQNRTLERVAAQREALRAATAIQTPQHRRAMQRATTARRPYGSTLLCACCSLRWHKKRRLRRIDPRRQATIAAEHDRRDQENESVAQVPSSRVRKRITELIEFKVVIGVIFVLLVLPLLDSLASSSDALPSDAPELAMLEAVHVEQPAAAAVVRERFLEMRPDTLELVIDDQQYVLNSQRMDYLRASEIVRLSLGAAQVAFDASAHVREEAVMGFIQTQAIIVLLGVGAGLLSRDVDTLLVQPLERLAFVLRPAQPAAIARMGNNFRKWLGQRDGEELSTRLLLASVEALFADLRPEVEELYKSRERALRFRQEMNHARKQAGGDLRSRAQALSDSAPKPDRDESGSDGDDHGEATKTITRSAETSGSRQRSAATGVVQLPDGSAAVSAEALDAILSASSRFYVPTDDICLLPTAWRAGWRGGAQVPDITLPEISENDQCPQYVRSGVSTETARQRLQLSPTALAAESSSFSRGTSSDGTVVVHVVSPSAVATTVTPPSSNVSGGAGSLAGSRAGTADSVTGFTVE